MLLCYEAGPAGYHLYRRLTSEGFATEVIAPSLIPKQPGQRVKTDRRDAAALARYLRSGDLTTVVVPDENTEALRDLTRARGDAKNAERILRQQLNAFLLRHGHSYPKTKWSKAHQAWIRKIEFSQEAQNRVLNDSLNAVEQAGERVARLMQDIADLVTADWQYAEVVKALMALRGVSLLTAVTLATELGDFRRFPGPTQMMSYLGLVPSEHTSGGRERRGRITRTGNTHARRVLVEAAWAYRHRPRLNADMRKRSAGLPKSIVAIAWKAQNRLCRRYYKMSQRGKQHNQTIIAVARELTGFVWAIGQEVLSRQPGKEV